MATIRDIARALNLSTSTVSRALTGASGISEDTRQLVKQTAEGMNYSVNRFAQSLVMGRSDTIGFMIPDISDSFFAKSAYGIEGALQSTPFSLAYTNVKRSPDHVCKYLRRAEESCYAGVFVTIDSWTDAVVNQIRSMRIPVLSLRRKTPESLREQVPFIDTDYFSGTETFLRYLLSLGHQEFGYIGYDTSVGDERMDAFVQVAQKHRMVYHAMRSRSYHNASVRVSVGYESTRKLLDEFGGTTAICAGDDQIALGVLQYLHENGIRVPEDVSVIGHDDRDVADLFCVQLTTMHQQLFEIGEQAGYMMLEMINHPDQNPASLKVPPKLVIRRTTSRCRPGQPEV